MFFYSMRSFKKFLKINFYYTHSYKFQNYPLSDIFFWSILTLSQKYIINSKAYISFLRSLTHFNKVILWFLFFKFSKSKIYCYSKFEKGFAYFRKACCSWLWIRNCVFNFFTCIHNTVSLSLFWVSWFLFFSRKENDFFMRFFAHYIF